jgi:hypothetical protein
MQYLSAEGSKRGAKRDLFYAESSFLGTRQEILERGIAVASCVSA